MFNIHSKSPRQQKKKDDIYIYIKEMVDIKYLYLYQF